MQPSDLQIALHMQRQHTCYDMFKILHRWLWYNQINENLDFHEIISLEKALV